MRRFLKLLLLAGLTVGVAFAVRRFMQIQQDANQVAGNIEAELDELDPVTRGAVLAKLSKDAVKRDRAHDDSQEHTVGSA